MACQSCVDKLARKLLAHHPRLDLIRAFELAERAVERVEARKPKRSWIQTEATAFTRVFEDLRFFFTKPCGKCFKKWHSYYVKKGFSQTEAEKLSRKLVKRVHRREKYEYACNLRNAWKSKLFRTVFLTNWHATFLWSFKHHRPLWVGVDFNPDYTQNCAGTCVTTACPYYTGDCPPNSNCYVYYASCPKATCACPAPLANSTQVSDSCACISASVACIACHPTYFYCSSTTYACTCQNTCGYNCDGGYTWNGSQCVLGGGAVAKRLLRNRVHVGL